MPMSDSELSDSFQGFPSENEGERGENSQNGVDDSEVEYYEEKDDTDPELKAKLEALKDTIISPPPFCSGVLPLEDEAFTLMYGKREPERKSGMINFLTASTNELSQLANACDPATFGLNDEDVMDLSYRTAGKMDNRQFMTSIDLKRAGLIDIIRYNLLDGKRGAKPMYAELYNMNVYGKGSFFKSHKDTPRSEEMFGSLVLIFPASHEGGALVLRHGTFEKVFDSSAAIKQATEPSIAYVAFFSDVEHEVLPVTSGHRVSITYNLYFGDAPSQMREVSSEAPVYKTLPHTANLITSELQRVLADSTFLSDGGVIGFGLSYKYSLLEKPEDVSILEYLEGQLKGRDALARWACKQLKLSVELDIVFDFSDFYEDFEVLCKSIPKMEDNCFCFDDDKVGLWHYIKKEGKGSVISAPSTGKRKRGIDFPVHWITELTGLNDVSVEFAEYGIPPSVEYFYGRPCLIACVGPSGDRTNPVLGLSGP